MSIITATAPFRIVTINTTSVGEFSKNTNSSFKNRLPQPIRMTGDWEVALDDISLPRATKFANKLNKANRFGVRPQILFKMGHTRRKRNPAPSDVDVRKVVDFTHTDLQHVTNSVSGIGFMKSIVEFFEDKRIEDNVDGDDMRYSHTVNNVEQRTYWKFKWEGEELVTDNELTYKGGAGNWTELGTTYGPYNTFVGPKTPYFYIHENIALAMGWIIWSETDHRYYLGPNLKQELFDPNLIPDLQSSADADVTELQGASHPLNNKKVFWTSNDKWHGLNGTAPIETGHNFIRLSYNCNWRFINLNAAFADAVGATQRTLLCYSDVAQPSVVGSQTTQLLREFYFEEGLKGEKTGSTYYEPHRKQYLPLRSNTVTIISTEIAEKSGELTDLSEGETTVTYHFRPVQ